MPAVGADALNLGRERRIFGEEPLVVGHGLHLCGLEDARRDLRADGIDERRTDVVGRGPFDRGDAAAQAAGGRAQQDFIERIETSVTVRDGLIALDRSAALLFVVGGIALDVGVLRIVAARRRRAGIGRHQTRPQFHRADLRTAVPVQVAGHPDLHAAVLGPERLRRAGGRRVVGHAVGDRYARQGVGHRIEVDGQRTHAVDVDRRPRGNRIRRRIERDDPPVGRERISGVVIGAQHSINADFGCISGGEIGVEAVDARLGLGHAPGEFEPVVIEQRRTPDIAVEVFGQLRDGNLRRGGARLLAADRDIDVGRARLLLVVPRRGREADHVAAQVLPRNPVGVLVSGDRIDVAHVGREADIDRDDLVGVELDLLRVHRDFGIGVDARLHDPEHLLRAVGRRQGNGRRAFVGRIFGRGDPESAVRDAVGVGDAALRQRAPRFGLVRLGAPCHRLACLGVERDDDVLSLILLGVPPGVVEGHDFGREGDACGLHVVVHVVGVRQRIAGASEGRGDERNITVDFHCRSFFGLCINTSPPSV